MHLYYRNVNDAFRGLVELFHTGDPRNPWEHRALSIVERGSRYGPVKMIEEPVTVTYTHPRERVLFNPARDANPFLHMYEALWMLAGRNDVAPLAYYAKRMTEFSDDGVTLNGAYGYRWRHVPDYSSPPYDGSLEKVDQLSLLIAHLKANPLSRRAVLQMWTVEDDLLKIGIGGQCTCGADRSGPSAEAHDDSCPAKAGSRDVCCLAWETKFRSPEGDTTIEELAGKFQTEEGFKFPVYSVDPVTGDQRLCWMTNAWKVGVRKVFRISLDDGSEMRLTGDHVVYRKRKRFKGKRCIGISIEECKVCDLVSGDSLLAELSKDAACRTSAGGYRTFKRNLFRNTDRRNMILEHREYLSLFEDLLEYRGEYGHSIHHKDGNKLNNRRDNITQLPNSVHFKIGKEGESNPHNRMSPEAKKTRGRKHAVSIKAFWASLSPELRSALITRKKNRTDAQWAMVRAHQSSKSNHKITSIKADGFTTVYDFTVPGRHNAVLDNGVVVHNCNLSVLFSVRPTTVEYPLSHDVQRVGLTYLDMTVTNRSNDLIWGMLGTNVVHFSVLQEYVAAHLGCEVGVYNQFTNNLHVYTAPERWKPTEWLDVEEMTEHVGETYPACSRLFPLIVNPAHFDRELPAFVGYYSGKPVSPKGYDPAWDEPFLDEVAKPMFVAFRYHKLKQHHEAMEVAESIGAADWRLTALEWLKRRAAHKLT